MNFKNIIDRFELNFINKKLTHIVLIDDDNDENAFFQESLSSLKFYYKYEFANSLDDALLLLKDDVPDYFFIDLNMPKQNGFQCIIKIRENHCFCNSMIILYSTALNKEMCRKAICLGANGFVKKAQPELLSVDLKRIFFSGVGVINYN